MERIARSWELARQSFRVLMRDKELLLLPVLSGLAVLAVCATFLAGVVLAGGQGLEADAPVVWPLLALFYVVTYTVGFFFQAALIAGALERLAGGDPTLSSALGAAWRRLGAIVTWGVIAGTIGLVLKSVQERSQLVGRLVIGLLGVAWSLATWFMVPVLVMERASVGDSFKRSAALFKRTWGEALAGNVGLGLAAFLVFLPIAAVAVLVGAAAGPAAAVGVGVPLGALAGVFFSALQGVFVAALYRYATTGEVAAGYDRALIAGAFRPR